MTQRHPKRRPTPSPASPARRAPDQQGLVAPDRALRPDPAAACAAAQALARVRDEAAPAAPPPTPPPPPEPPADDSTPNPAAPDAATTED